MKRITATRDCGVTWLAVAAYNVGFGHRWVQSKTVNVGSKDTQLHTLQEC